MRPNDEYGSNFLRGDENYENDGADDVDDSDENLVLPWNVQITQYAGSKKCTHKVTSLVYLIYYPIQRARATRSICCHCFFMPVTTDSLAQTQEGDKLVVNYKGSIAESSRAGKKGKVFDNSYKRFNTFSH